jgi:hypothetical protein
MNWNTQHKRERLYAQKLAAYRHHGAEGVRAVLRGQAHNRGTKPTPGDIEWQMHQFIRSLPVSVRIERAEFVGQHKAEAAILARTKDHTEQIALLKQWHAARRAHVQQKMQRLREHEAMREAAGLPIAYVGAIR